MDNLPKKLFYSLNSIPVLSSRQRYLPFKELVAVFYLPAYATQYLPLKVKVFWTKTTKDDNPGLIQKHLQDTIFQKTVLYYAMLCAL